MDKDTHVERVLVGRLGDVLIGADASCFKRLKALLLVLVGDEMAAERELAQRYASI